MSGISTTLRKFLFRPDKEFRVYACVTSRTIVYSAVFFWVLEITDSQDATTDIDAKYVKRRGSVQGCALGVAKPNFNICTPFPPKTTIFGPDLDGT